jgi:hypothetical protein
MIINGKVGISLRLHCPLMCGGYIENDVLLYLLETSELYIYGKCGECGHSGNLTVNLMELLIQCPTTTAVM